MFLEYRIRRLKIKVDTQKELVNKLELAEKQYEESYYTDKFHEAHCKWLEMNSKLKWLKDKLSKQQSAL